MGKNIVAALLIAVLAAQDSNMSEVAKKFRSALPGLEVVETESSVRVVLPIVEKEDPKVTFYWNGSNISEKDSKQLDGLIGVVKLHPEIKRVRIEVSGADLELANRRASKVCAYIAKQADGLQCEPSSVIDSEDRRLRFYLMKE